MTPEPGIIPEDEFWEHYKPIPAPAGTSDGGNLWDFEQAQHIPLNQVWTVVESGGENDCWYAGPGFHVVNRIGYCVTEQPWSDPAKDAYYYFDERDCYYFLLSTGEIEGEFGEDEADARQRLENSHAPGVSVVRLATDEELDEG